MSENKEHPGIKLKDLVLGFLRHQNKPLSEIDEKFIHFWVDAAIEKFENEKLKNIFDMESGD